VKTKPKGVTDGSPQFNAAASLILDAIEDAFRIVAPDGRLRCHKAIVEILRYYMFANPSPGLNEPVIRWERLLRDLQRFEQLHTLRPLAEYHEDNGTVLWWHLPIQEPPYVGAGPGMGDCKRDGTPTECARLLAEGWLTHWSPIPQPEVCKDCTPDAAQ
jgi:hypothetical protein